jgi:murein DD-endopeptidase MepM/ murein hydrolase activator NlpD
MKRLLFLCFLLGSSLFPVPSQNQSDLEQLLSEASVCSDAKISQYSKELAEFAQGLYVSLSDVQDKVQIQKEDLEKKQQSYRQNELAFQAADAKQVLLVQRFQSDAFDWSDYIRQWKHYYVYLELQQEKIQVNKLENALVQTEQSLAEIEGNLEQIATLQESLAARYYASHPFFMDGEYQGDAAILGNDGLPAIGGIKNSTTMDLQACLAGAQNASIESSSSFLWPVEGGVISAGTWEYPGGGMHLGLDVAASLYSNLYAPANGLILYADAPVESNSGYLGNYSGYPYGAGNSIAMLAVISNKLYAITFAHLSNEHYVTAGQMVQQGDVLALTGNSGNSTGPHTHVEVFEIHVSFAQAVNYFASTTDFAWGCGWSEGGTSSSIATRIRPEQVF